MSALHVHEILYVYNSLISKKYFIHEYELGGGGGGSGGDDDDDNDDDDDIILSSTVSVALFHVISFHSTVNASVSCL
jgi:hypothetical protein